MSRTAAVWSAKAGLASCWPGRLARRRFVYRNGSTWGSGSGTGEVSVMFEPDGQEGRFRFQLVPPSEEESFDLEQTEPGRLRLIWTRGASTVLFRQGRASAREASQTPKR